MDIRGKRALRASLLALAATAASLLGSAQSANAQTQFNFSPSGTGVGLPTTGLQFAAGSALVLNTSGGNPAIPLTDGETFTLLYQTHLVGLIGQSNAAFNTAIGTGQVTEVAILTEVAHVSGTTATFTLAPTGPQQVSIYANPTAVFNDAAGTGFVTTPANGFATGREIATLTPQGAGYQSAFTTFSGLQTFNQTNPAQGTAAGTATTAINGGGFTQFNNTVVQTNPLFFNPPTGIPPGVNSTIGSSLNSVFNTGVAPSLQFTNPISLATFAALVGQPSGTNGITGPDLELRVDGFTQGFAAVPEPASMTLMGLGVVGALAVVRRTRARVA